MANFDDARTKVMNESGRLLWVCRRNGTWWPAQILSLDQVPESCMPSRRSGTPVKLLGKEDAIIEWYNIEKSKRIKEFRCSKFNECIEKVKVSADNLSKIPVNYARREDAILHALKLEGAQNSEDKPQHGMAKLSSLLVLDEVDQKVDRSSKLRGNSNLGHELSFYNVPSKDRNFEKQISQKRKMKSPHAELLTTQMLLAYPASGPFPEFSDGIYDQLNLSDVKVEVQSYYKSQNVPFTSVESGLNGHSIVGHPLNIEVLDKEFSNNLLSGISKVQKISSSPMISSLIASEQKIIAEVEDLKKTVVRCVPVGLIFSRLKVALRC